MLYSWRGALHVDVKTRQARIPGTDIVLKEGDIITLNGTIGYAYLGALPMMDASEKSALQTVYDHGR